MVTFIRSKDFKFFFSYFLGDRKIRINKFFKNKFTTTLFKLKKPFFIRLTNTMSKESRYTRIRTM